MGRVVKNVKSASPLALETTTAPAFPVTMVTIVKVQYFQTLMHSSYFPQAIGQEYGTEEEQGRHHYPTGI